MKTTHRFSVARREVVDDQREGMGLVAWTVLLLYALLWVL